MELIRKIRIKIKDGSIKDMWMEWKWIYRYTKVYRWPIAGYILLSMLGIVMGLVSSIASKDLIDIVTGFQSSKILPMAVLMVAMALFSLLVNSLGNRSSLKINLSIQNNIQSDVFQQIMDVDWRALSGFHSGDILNRFGNDIKIVASSAVSWFPQLITGLFSFFASLAVILYYDPAMALIALINAPVMLISSRVLMSKMRGHTQNVKKADSAMLSFQEETFYNVDSIKSFGLNGLFGRKLKAVQEQFFHVNLEYNRFSILSNAVLSVVGMVIEYSCFGWGIYRLWTGAITFGEMTLFLGQAGRLSSTFNSLVGIIPTTIGAAVSAGRIMELIELPKENNDQETADLLVQGNERGLRVRLRGVDFGYCGERNILMKADMEASPGEIIALVGPSGEGKTTLIRMFLGLIYPDLGEAYLEDEENHRAALGASTRKYFSYVPQGNTLFSGSIADNLRMVKEDAGDGEIIDALKAACAYEFVEKMPDGIYSLLGEKGAGISEGQAQRIAIARAVLRDAPILLLDEATSALDAATECRVLQNLVQKRPDKTCIVTTHRPSVLNLCQRLYCIQDAQVRELSEEESGRMAMEF